MTEPTATGAQPAGVQPQIPGPEPDLESQADSLMDRIVDFDAQHYDLESGEPLKEPRQPKPPEGKQPVEGAAEGEQEVEAAEPEKPEGEETEVEAERPDKPEGDGKEYGSLDEYLADNKIDPESFMELPVTVKVDGKDQTFSLKEVVDGFNLKTVSYERMQQVAREREQFTGEQTQVRQALGVQIQRTEALLKSAQELFLGDYAGVTQEQLNELRARNPGEYAAFMADYNTRRGAIQALIQQADQARQEQAQAAAKQRAASLPGEVQKLLRAFPEWRDPVKRTAALKLVNDYGASKGFSPAELNGILDARYMEVLHDAAMYRQLKAKAPAALKRVRSAPKMAKPGTRTTADPKAAQYSSTRERALKNPDDQDAQLAWANALANA